MISLPESPVRLHGRTFGRQVSRLLLAVALAGPLAAAAQPAHGTPGVRTSTVSLPTDTEVDGIRVAELSGLAWDADAGMLYAIADSGSLFRFRLRVADGVLQAVEPVSAVALQRSTGQGKPRRLDAEGLALRQVRGQVELLVATEGRPAVWRFGPGGEALGQLALPPELVDPTRYAERNTMLEAVAVHPQHGLVLSPELPLQGDDVAQGHRLRAAHHHWQIEALDPGRSRLKAMDITAGGELLALERSGSGKRRVSAVRLAKLAHCGGPTPCSMRTLALLDQDSGAENFEGMTTLGQRQALLVSDNRGGKKRETVFLLLQWDAEPGQPEKSGR